MIEALEKAGAKVIYQEIDKATNADPNAGTATFVGVMKANPGIKVVVTDHGGADRRTSASTPAPRR